MRQRRETDSLGEYPVPADALYGIHTARALKNFPRAGGKCLADYPALVEALIAVKLACARCNLALGELPEQPGSALVEAAAAALAAPPYEAFPLAMLHGGGGTSANMNSNEVLANLAEELLGGARGQYQRVHPNDHANRNQSTNDVYPTACHLALLSVIGSFRQSASSLESALTGAIERLGSEPRLARTCLRDAVPVTLGDLFSGYRAGLARCRSRVEAATAELRAINLGGTLCGRAQDVPKPYFDRVIDELREVTGRAELCRSDNLFDAAQNLDDMVSVTASLDLYGRTLIKIAMDLRLLSSGPEGGFGEIELPAVQAGSSAMPGKINPVIPEYAVQQAMQACGYHSACVQALSHGELDLNIWESLVVSNAIGMVNALIGASTALAEAVFPGLEVRRQNIARHLRGSLEAVTQQARIEGYGVAAGHSKRRSPDDSRGQPPRRG